jgi:Asp-tRNA(Asn)/Glu-tRNA(Gln) amidotransferase A subunit family amidase
MAKSTKALLTGRIQMCKTNPSIAHIGLATHGRSIQIGSRQAAVSTGLVGQTPVGVQIVAGRYREDLCLRAGEAIEARGTPPAPIDPRN